MQFHGVHTCKLGIHVISLTRSTMLILTLPILINFILSSYIIIYLYLNAFVMITEYKQSNTAKIICMILNIFAESLKMHYRCFMKSLQVLLL